MCVHVFVDMHVHVMFKLENNYDAVLNYSNYVIHYCQKEINTLQLQSSQDHNRYNILCTCVFVRVYVRVTRFNIWQGDSQHIEVQWWEDESISDIKSVFPQSCFLVCGSTQVRKHNIQKDYYTKQQAACFLNRKNEEKNNS